MNRTIKKNIQRQIRYEVESHNHPETHSYNVLIINKRAPTKRIIQKISEVFKPTENLVTLCEGAISGTGLRYELLTFDSHGMPSVDIPWHKVYNGKVTQDRNLANRTTRDGLKEYVETKIVCGEI